MFFIPLAIMLGADVTFGEFIYKSLIPTTIGNIIGLYNIMKLQSSELISAEPNKVAASSWVWRCGMCMGSMKMAPAVQTLSLT